MLIIKKKRGNFLMMPLLSNFVKKLLWYSQFCITLMVTPLSSSTNSREHFSCKIGMKQLILMCIVMMNMQTEWLKC